MKETKKSYGFAVLTIFLWSTLATVSKLLLNSLDVMLVLAVSSTIGAVALLLYNQLRGNLKDLWQCSWKELISMCLLGFLGFFLYNWFYLLGIARLPSQQAMVINYLWPALIIVFSSIIYKQKMTGKKILAVLFSLVGVTIVAMNGNPRALVGGNLQGVLCCLAAAVCYALYASINKGQTYPKELSMFIVFAVTAVSSIAGASFSGSLSEISKLTIGMWAGLFFSGVFINAIGYTSWMLALEYGKTAVISNLAYLIPFLSMVIARIVLKEEISMYSIIGLFLIISGIGIQIREQ
ncbi:MAG: DMT family transporter [Hespellia sp.]|nr:DMT family transporter [Hespellia sp.]